MSVLAMRWGRLFTLAGLGLAAACAPSPTKTESDTAAPTVAAEEQPSVERGRYLVTIAGCNDCHTAGFAPSNGKVAESDWLRGDRLGYRGPWGTTYPTNLRTHLAALSEDQWVGAAKISAARPPMPVWALQAMSDTDLRSIYRLVKSLPGPVGEPAPAALPPGEAPNGPVLQWPEPPPGAAPAAP